jgi:hypothetical protein
MIFKRRWDIIHKLEAKVDVDVLKGLTQKESFKFFLNLYNLSLVNKASNNLMNIEKINALLRAHLIFKKVKK